MILFGYGCKQMNSINELVGATNEIGNAKWGQNAQNLLVDNNGSQIEELQLRHTTYSRNDIGQKCESNCGLWVLNEII